MDRDQREVRDQYLYLRQKMYSCREIYKTIGFDRWENFNHNVEKAIQLIQSGTHRGTIIESHKLVEIGSGAKRRIIDYTIDDDALELIKQLSYNKTIGEIAVRNEVVLLSLLRKYCVAKGNSFEGQFLLSGFRYDALIGGRILLEFDEQHHGRGKQKYIDDEKNRIAQQNNFKIVRVGIRDDIIDIILKVEKEM